MSTILEALRKSELARRARRSPVYRDAAPAATPALLRWLSLFAMLALMAALGVSVWLVARPSSGVVSVPSDAATAPAEPGGTPADRSAPSTVNRAGHTPPSPVAGLDGQLPANRKTPAAGSDDRSGTASKVPAVPRAPSVQQTGEAPWLASLPAAFRERLPALVVNIHVYAPDEAGRILYINNRPVRRGEQLPGGVVVEEILPEGVLLRAHGQRFRLPRPS